MMHSGLQLAWGDLSGGQYSQVCSYSSGYAVFCMYNANDYYSKWGYQTGYIDVSPIYTTLDY